MEKSDIRKKIKKLRLSLTEEEKQKAANEVFAQLENTKEFLSAENILFYYSLPDELPTPAFLEKWSDRKKIYLPRVNGSDLDILAYNKSKLETGAFDIEEPMGDDLYSISEIDMIIVPAVAFDKQGNRLGRGKGYYDRLLSKTTAVKIGVCYNFQIIDKIPVEPHDVPMNMIVSPDEIIRC